MYNCYNCCCHTIVLCRTSDTVDINRQMSQVSVKLIRFIYTDATSDSPRASSVIYFFLQCTPSGLIQTDCYPRQADADVRQRESAEIQIRDTAKRWAGQHGEDCRIAENADGQHDRDYDAVSGPYQGRCLLSGNILVLDSRAPDGDIVVIATQLSTAQEKQSTFISGFRACVIEKT